jgi:hypothetical protein
MRQREAMPLRLTRRRSLGLPRALAMSGKLLIGASA